MKLKKVISSIFTDCDVNHDGLLNKEEILAAARDNMQLRLIFEESIRNVKQID
jgi:hypothetical protein